MEISKVSLLNFYGTKAQALKMTTEKAKDAVVDFNQYAYGIPTDVLPRADFSVLTKHPYAPIDSPIAIDKYTKNAEQPKPIATIIDYVSESSIL